IWEKPCVHPSAALALLALCCAFHSLLLPPHGDAVVTFERAAGFWKAIRGVEKVKVPLKTARRPASTGLMVARQFSSPPRIVPTLSDLGSFVIFLRSARL